MGQAASPRRQKPVAELLLQALVHLFQLTPPRRQLGGKFHVRKGMPVPEEFTGERDLSIGGKRKPARCFPVARCAQQNDGAEVDEVLEGAKTVAGANS
jgi:hypothetical protein